MSPNVSQISSVNRTWQGFRAMREFAVTQLNFAAVDDETAMEFAVARRGFRRRMHDDVRAPVERLIR